MLIVHMYYLLLFICTHSAIYFVQLIHFNFFILVCFSKTFFLFLCIVFNVVCKKMLYFYYVRNKDIQYILCSLPLYLSSRAKRYLMLK